MHDRDHDLIPDEIESFWRQLFSRRAHRYVPRRMLRAAQDFIHLEASSGIVLLLAAIVALVWANSRWDESYFDLLHTRLVLDLSVVRLDETLQHWVNDGLMTLFFFLMGLEIKRELVRGELSSPRRAALPAAAAVGGMIVPAVIYVGFNLGTDGIDGWGIPMATDIAFALGVLSLLGNRIPFAAKIFLLALAITDDIGAIVVIAFFYTSSVDLEALVVAAAILAAVVLLGRGGVRNLGVYVIAGLMLWLAVFESGVHATLAGVMLGLLTPATPPFDSGGSAEPSLDGVAADPSMEAPLDRIEPALHPWVSFLVVPLFALVNAGVVVSGDVLDSAVASPVSQGVLLGLLLGKPAGIFAFAWLAVRLGIGEMPRGMSWIHVLGIGLLGGIGFTVSLLVTSLAFGEAVEASEAKLAVLVASVVSGTAGLLFLSLFSRRVHDDGLNQAATTG